MEVQRLFRPVVRRAFHSLQVDAEGQGGARAVEGNHGPAEDKACKFWFDVEHQGRTRWVIISVSPIC